MKKTMSMMLGLALAVGSATVIMYANDEKAGDHKSGDHKAGGKDHGKDKKEDHGKH